MPAPLHEPGTASTRRWSPPITRNTMLTTAYGRNIQAALRKGHDQAGSTTCASTASSTTTSASTPRRAGVPIYTGRAGSDIRRDHRRRHAPVRRDQLHAPGAGVRRERDPDVALVQPSVAQHQPAEGPRLDELAELHAGDGPAPGDALRRRRGAPTGTSRSGTNRPGCIRWATPATTSCTSNTVKGLLQADPMMRVGGPAGSQGGSTFMVDGMIRVRSARPTRQARLRDATTVTSRTTTSLAAWRGDRRDRLPQRCWSTGQHHHVAG